MTVKVLAKAFTRNFIFLCSKQTPYSLGTSGIPSHQQTEQQVKKAGAAASTTTPTTTAHSWLSYWMERTGSAAKIEFLASSP